MSRTRLAQAYPSPIKDGARAGRMMIGNAGWIIAALVAMSVAIIWWQPSWPGKSSSDANELRRTMIQLCGGLFAIAAFYLHFVRVRHSARGEVNSRFQKYSELLGSARNIGASTVPNLETRLCAIHGLWAIGRDSEADYPTTVDALAAYVRINAVETSLMPGDPRDDRRKGILREDIATALEVLSRLSPHRIRRPDVILCGAYLPDLKLTRCSLRGWDLSRCFLTSAVFDKVDLSGVKLDNATANSNFQTAHFDESTSFANTDLSGASFFRENSAEEVRRGLSPDQIVKARDWASAEFSNSFLERCQRKGSASAA